MDIRRDFDNKNILIWGYGREGQSTEAFLKQYCRPKEITVFEGSREEIDEDKFDLIIKSPGIIMDEDHPKYTSQTEIFLSAFSQNVIGITGTKGKSTTSALLYHVLKNTLKRKVILLGNIGEPCLNHYGEIDADTVVVFEMSCHQLAHTKVSPHIAVFLNLYEEHLDYYQTFEKYCMAKCNITKYQTEQDVLYVGEMLGDIATRAQKIIIPATGFDYDLKILGEHNQYNAEFVYRIATEQFGASAQEVRQFLKTFEGLSHRLQLLGVKDGISYYDDSISTIPDATISALAAVRNAHTVLIGGMDRGINYDELISYIRKNPGYTYIFMYDSGKRILKTLKDLPNCHYAGDLKNAVDMAKKLTPEGYAVILSPAAASYGFFKNFEERGDKFREYAGL
ncbi:MAG: UDP-N-acetylmuramoyl-L-alanine--D-glutamate ligase [Lachnospiraceae bacterium]|nr:UDP-N-acetylmuramoyl-L-alanine--D-glutamate ligase [Lachnospiraceae bacterium]